jgi:hypothetical protein
MPLVLSQVWFCTGPSQITVDDLSGTTAFAIKARLFIEKVAEDSPCSCHIQTIDGHPIGCQKCEAEAILGKKVWP